MSRHRRQQRRRARERARFDRLRAASVARRFAWYREAWEEHVHTPSSIVVSKMRPFPGRPTFPPSPPPGWKPVQQREVLSWGRLGVGHWRNIARARRGMWLL